MSDVFGGYPLGFPIDSAPFKSAASPVPVLDDRKPCDFFAKYGNCRKGDDCKFSHNSGRPSEFVDWNAMYARPAQVQPSWQGSMLGFGSAYPTLPFQRMSGMVDVESLASNRYTDHKGASSRSSRVAPKHERKFNKDGKVICDFFVRFGDCKKGDACQFLHEKPEGAKESAPESAIETA
ncbi:hypothetical protein CYMTET_43715 [Cymbomonas tetramitiformis]|uniref:C3H1-type domain-containing protein n=1 Tax=Cymbomonas tetramitiformis TaxID=36881 RepID=A0AAE0C1N4_9CHLO|nr:hypothetical protein CYMTET_43715 [Cymbomonas tetramitiformis]